jgi:hypothetical protein
MGSEWTRATLRVSSATMTTRELTEHLGREPTKAFERCSLMSPRNPRSARREEALWLLESPLPDGSSLEAHLDWAAETVGSMREQLASLPPGSVDLFVGWALPAHQAGFTLRREVLAKLEGVPLDIGFDLYGPGDEGD